MVAFITISIHKQRAAAEYSHNKELFTDCGSEDVGDLRPDCCMSCTPLESMQSRVPKNESGGALQLAYFSLIQAGVEEAKLRITYVKALKLNQAHMVLAYYSSPRAVPLILDNLTPKILPATKRRDLSPVYSFNGLGMWLERMKGSSIRIGDPNRLNMWMDLLVRMDEQEMESWLHLPKEGQ